MSAPFVASYVALWFLVLLLTIVTIVAVRQLGVMNLRLGGQFAMSLPDGPAVGEQAPEFTAKDTEGRVTRSPWLQGRPSLLLFVSPGCSACRELLPSIRAIRRSDGERAEILLLSSSDGSSNDENDEYARRTQCSVIADPDLVEAYRVDATPYGIVVDRDGLVRAKGVVNQIEHLETLLDSLSEPGPPKLAGTLNSSGANSHADTANEIHI